MNRLYHRCRKPGVMVYLTMAVAVGILATTSISAEAAEPPAPLIDTLPNLPAEPAAADWRNWLWGRIREAHRVGALPLAQPSGPKGPVFGISRRSPDDFASTLTAGGDRRIGALSDDSNVYLSVRVRFK